ncbi:MAG TPA: type II secretion system protein [Candidatus Paceibacterota bacterium]|nr:type II secretion system protein [Candidatus Paceibacterota bacterium]
MKVSKSAGFTLIELLVVISIIALLSSVVIAALIKARVRARDTARLANAHQIALAMQFYENDKGTFAISGSGYQNTGKGFMAKSGETDYPTSILSVLRSNGYYSADTIKDPIYGTDNYYLGVCTTTLAYNIYIKLEQTELQQPTETLSSGCDSTNALALGFNFIQGKGVDNNTSAIAGGGGAGSGTTTIVLNASGSSVSAGMATSTLQIAMLTANVGNIGSGTFSALPQALNNVANAGAHTLQRPDGKYLIVSGNGTGSNIYDPVADTFTAGPSTLYAVTHGAFSLRRADGKFAVFPLATAGTAIYDPANNTFAVGGTGPGDPIRVGASANALANGNAFIPAGNTSYSTYLYNLTTGAVTSGPGLGGNSIGVGGLALTRADGVVVVVGGGNGQSSYLYYPGSNTTGAGPGVGIGVSWGGHAMQKPDGKFLIVGGNSNSTVIYNPSNNTFAAGPGLTCSAREGGHSLQRADGNYLIICGNNTGATVIYNPTTDTMTAGPSLPFAVTAGGHAFQRPDGKYVIVGGGGLNNVRAYDAGYTMSGTYTTEDINMPALNTGSTLQYTSGGTGSATVKVKTAVSQSGLDAASYTTVSPGGNINPVAGAQWIKIQVTLNRSIPTMPYKTNVWIGEDGTTYLRTLTTPTVSNLEVIN